MSRTIKEQALILYKEIVHKLRDTDLTQNDYARSFTQNLVYTFRPPTPDNSLAQAVLAGPPKRLNVNYGYY